MLDVKERQLLGQILTNKGENIITALSSAALTKNVLLAALNSPDLWLENSVIEQELMALVNHRLLDYAAVSTAFTTDRPESAEYLIQSKYATSTMVETVLNDTKLLNTARSNQGNACRAAHRLVCKALKSSKCPYAQASIFFSDADFGLSAYMNPNIPEDVLRKEYAAGKQYEVSNNYNLPEDLSRKYFNQYFKEKKDRIYLIRVEFSPKLRTKNFPQDLLLEFARIDVLLEVVKYPNFPQKKLVALYNQKKKDSLLINAILSSPNCPLSILRDVVLDPASDVRKLMSLVRNPKLNQKVLLFLSLSKHPRVRAWAKLHPNAPDYLCQI